MRLLVVEDERKLARVLTRALEAEDYDVVIATTGDQGTGLGLAIAKWAVEVNGGHLSVEDGASGGSVFRIVLPISAAPLAEHHEHATQRPEGHP